jgi:hypothetical protein
VRLRPFANVEVAEPVTVMPLVEERPAAAMPPANVVVAVEVEVRVPTTRFPAVVEAR